MFAAARPLNILEGVISEHFDARNSNLVKQWQPMMDRLSEWTASDLDPYCKAIAARIGPSTISLDRTTKCQSVITLPSQSNLRLSSHPYANAAAADVKLRFRVHSPRFVAPARVEYESFHWAATSADTGFAMDDRS
jgi:hypothetical protein